MAYILGSELQDILGSWKFNCVWCTAGSEAHVLASEGDTRRCMLDAGSVLNMSVRRSCDPRSNPLNPINSLLEDFLKARIGCHDEES